MIAVFQLLHGGVDINPDDFFAPSTALHTTGHPWKLSKPPAQSRVRRNSFNIRVINDWNALPLRVVGSETLNQFKSRLDKHWASIAYSIPVQD